MTTFLGRTLSITKLHLSDTSVSPTPWTNKGETDSGIFQH